MAWAPNFDKTSKVYPNARPRNCDGYVLTDTTDMCRIPDQNNAIKNKLPLVIWFQDKEVYNFKALKRLSQY